MMKCCYSPSSTAPKALRVVIVAGDKPVTERDVHAFVRSRRSQSFQALTRLDIPQLYCFILATTRQGRTLRTENNRPNPIGMSKQNFHAFTSTNIPQPHCLVITATRQ